MRVQLFLELARHTHTYTHTNLTRHMRIKGAASSINAVKQMVVLYLLAVELLDCTMAG